MLLSKIIFSTCTAIGCSMLAYSLGLGMIGAFIAYVASGLTTMHMLRSIGFPTARQPYSQMGRKSWKQNEIC